MVPWQHGESQGGVPQPKTHEEGIRMAEQEALQQDSGTKQMEKRFVLCPNMYRGVWLTEDDLEIIKREFPENGPFGPEIEIVLDEEHMETLQFLIGFDEFYCDESSRVNDLLECIFMLGYKAAKKES